MSEHKPVRVLIADDYLPMVVALQRLLSLSCNVVATVPDCDGLLDAMKRLRPDVVLLDLNLPGGNSLLACEEITRTAQGTRVLVLTGGLDPRLRPYVLAAGASAFIDKTAVANELLSAIVPEHSPVRPRHLPPRPVSSVSKS
jgi:DNA-binding NarL/FixJ family response regulator